MQLLVISVCMIAIDMDSPITWLWSESVVVHVDEYTHDQPCVATNGSNFTVSSKSLVLNVGWDGQLIKTKKPYCDITLLKTYVSVNGHTSMAKLYGATLHNQFVIPGVMVNNRVCSHQ